MCCTFLKPDLITASTASSAILQPRPVTPLFRIGAPPNGPNDNRMLKPNLPGHMWHVLHVEHRGARPNRNLHPDPDGTCFDMPPGSVEASWKNYPRRVQTTVRVQQNFKSLFRFVLPGRQQPTQFAVSWCKTIGARIILATPTAAEILRNVSKLFLRMVGGNPVAG